MDGIFNLICLVFKGFAIGSGKNLLIAYLCILLEVWIEIIVKEISND